MKPCSICGCSGEYEEKRITHVVKRRGETIVLDNVKAEVCSVCGDTLLTLSTAEEIEKLLENLGEPSRMAPVYEMPDRVAAY